MTVLLHFTKIILNYKKVSTEWLNSIYDKAGWKVVNYILDDGARKWYRNKLSLSTTDIFRSLTAAGSTMTC